MRTTRVGPSAQSVTSRRPEPGRSVCQATACSGANAARARGRPSTTRAPGVSAMSDRPSGCTHRLACAQAMRPGGSTRQACVLARRGSARRSTSADARPGRGAASSMSSTCGTTLTLLTCTRLHFSTFSF